MRHDHAAELKLAASRLDGTAKHTQIIASPVLSEMTGHTILLKPENLQEGHVVLAWVEGCRYVVHRIIEINGNQVVLMGDGNIAGIEHCRLDEVAALAINVVTPKGKHHPLYSPWRVRASRLWWRLLPVRRWILAIYRRTILKMI